MISGQDQQIKVSLVVLEGNEKGRTFVFSDQDNFLLGRDAQGTHAHFRLSPSDTYVSRNHFLLEINPPDCYLRDAGSLNGTFVIRRNAETTIFFLEGRQEKGWGDMAAYLARQFQCQSCRKVEENLVRLYPGDLISVGDTLLEVKIELTEKDNEQVQSFQCIHCGKAFKDMVLEKEAEYLIVSDFLCSECRNKQSAKRSSKTTAVSCFGCRKMLTTSADSDGRTEELRDVALYWCEACASSQKEDVPISRIGSYRILRELGTGGFGVVYLVWHERTGRIAALKLTKEKIKRQESLLKRFKNEILIMKALCHPNLVRLYDDGIFEKEYYYFVSEYLPEGSLSDLFQNRYKMKMPYKETCNLICQALDGLSYFHKQKGYVHRDLKPENILVRRNEKGEFIAKLGDFGLSRSYVLHGGTITKEGDWAGTIFYCPPEQITNFKNVKPHSDVYAMGVSVYFLITGEFPYDFPRNRKEQMEKIAKGEKLRDPVDYILGDDSPMPIEKKMPDIPLKIARAINKAIDKNASRRFSSAEEFKKALGRS